MGHLSLTLPATRRGKYPWPWGLHVHVISDEPGCSADWLNNQAIFRIHDHLRLFTFNSQRPKRVIPILSFLPALYTHLSGVYVCCTVLQPVFYSTFKGAGFFGCLCGCLHEYDETLSCWWIQLSLELINFWALLSKRRVPTWTTNFFIDNSAGIDVVTLNLADQRIAHHCNNPWHVNAKLSQSRSVIFSTAGRR